MRTVIPGLLLILTVATSSGAQTSADSGDVRHPAASPTPESRAGGPVLSRERVLTLGGVVVATLALEPLDQRIQTAFQSPWLHRSAALKGDAKRIAFLGGPGPFLTGSALFVAGRTFHSDGMADLGVHLTEGVTLAATIAAIGKGVSGRALPNVTSEEPGEFSFGRGFHHHNGAFVSFPSGHTAAAFATAAVLTSEASRADPSWRWVVGPVAYGGASLVALTRVYQNVHWASDLPLAALIGTWSGNALVRRQHDGNQHAIDRWLLGTSVMPTAHGDLLVGWSSSALDGRQAIAHDAKAQARKETIMAMTITSTAFTHNGAIPKLYTCDGKDISPPLAWSGVPAGTKSIVLIVDDPDAPDPAAPKMTWVHWVLYNIPPSTLGLAEGIKALPAGTLSGMTDFKRTGYGGPCPPIGRHRYFHKLYALDTVLQGLSNTTKADVEKAMQGHVVAQAELLGTYSH